MQESRGFYNFIIVTTVICHFHTGFLFSQPVPAGRRLKEIVADKYPSGNVLIGGTMGSEDLATPAGVVLDREFSYVTPENDFKQGTVHPDNSDTWNWERADAWVDHVAKTGQILRIHGPIGPQASKWTFEEERTPAELEKNLRDYMHKLCERYNGKRGFEYLDVVNETVTYEGAWFGRIPREGWQNPWLKLGIDEESKIPRYIIYAFEVATRHAPDLKLIYNQHCDWLSPAAWTTIKTAVQSLRDRGLRVDGIGGHFHVFSGWECVSGQQNELRSLIDWAHENGLEFHVTEFSAWLLDGNSPAELEKQAGTYRTVLDILLEKRSTGVVGWNTWHIYDGDTWKQEYYPSMFDAAFRPKPAYYAVQKALETARQP